MIFVVNLLSLSLFHAKNAIFRLSSPKNIRLAVHFSASVTTRPVVNTMSQQVENDVKEVEKWLNIENTNTESSTDTTDAFQQFLEKRASTVVPDESAADDQQSQFQIPQPANNNPNA